jgi:hypothetical protein
MSFFGFLKNAVATTGKATYKSVKHVSGGTIKHGGRYIKGTYKPYYSKGKGWFW